MYIIGAVLLFIMPYLAGRTCKGILRWKETNQIETYLIGFFFLFFLQGLIFVPAVLIGMSFTLACTILLGAVAAVALLAVVFIIGKKIKLRNSIEDNQDKKKISRRKGDVWGLCGVLLIWGLLILRMVLGMNILRDDIVLETVNTTIQTDTMFVYHPLLGRMLEAGMITSKKIVTIPLFYASLSVLTGIEATTLLYVFVNAMVLGCSYYSLAILYTKVTNITRGKLYTLWITYGLLIFAGDYHQNTLAYKILYQGYEGSTICFAVIMPYLLSLVISWYKQECEAEKVTMRMRIEFILKIVLGLAVSMVITSLGTGFIFLFLTLVIAAVCCLLKSIKEVNACKES